jgi:hypothetical protein
MRHGGSSPGSLAAYKETPWRRCHDNHTRRDPAVGGPRSPSNLASQSWLGLLSKQWSGLGRLGPGDFVATRSHLATAVSNCHRYDRAAFHFRFRSRDAIQFSIGISTCRTFRRMFYPKLAVQLVTKPKDKHRRLAHYKPCSRRARPSDGASPKLVPKSNSFPRQQSTAQGERLGRC